MDSLGGYDDARLDETGQGATDVVTPDEEALAIGTDERRMHVRAYNYWVSLLRGRAYPLIDELDPENIADFGPHSVLLDFTTGIEDPLIAYLGSALREECSLESGQRRIAEVPSRSLLSRLTDHYLQIIANQAPIGFEAEFVSTRGNNTLYRGILMPFSSTGSTIDFIYGVINWKELVDARTQAKLDSEVAGALRHAPRHDDAAPVWADGPSAAVEEVAESAVAATGDAEPETLAGRLFAARESAAAALLARIRSRGALYRALGLAYGFARAAEKDVEGYKALIADAGLTIQARAPMTPVVKLVFGADYDKTRVTEFAAVLSAARREGMMPHELPRRLEELPGGIKAMVAAERAQRTAGEKPARRAPTLPDRAPLARVALPVESPAGELVVLLARACEGGTFDIVGSVSGDDGLARKVAKSMA